ncbi:MAG: hypothetical protein LLG04_18190 [Parachlamydia sp.]|nr:hypothetical protein [Parachlamydia sp.]
MNPDYYVKRVELNTGDESEYPKENQAVQSTGQKPAKDFKKILGKSQKDQRDDQQKKKTAEKEFQGEEAQIGVTETKDDEENASEVASMSLFDLSKKAGQAKKAPIPGSKKEVEQVAQVQSPSDLFKTAGTKEPKKAFVDPRFAVKEEPAATPIVDKKEKFATNYTQEQPDLSYVNPFTSTLQAQSVIPTSEPKIERAAALTPAMRELIEQIVKQMYTVTTHQDKTDTVMTLQYPPLFKDVRVIVTSYETARGQFNIAFENLSQAAQRILDLEENRRTLINALEQKGYNVQILTTTTIMEPRLNVEEPFAQQKQDDQGQGGQQDQPRKRKRDEDNPYA